MVVPALIGAGASLLGGLFGKKPKEKSAEQNSREAILGQAQGARQASDKYGFNPLTLLGASSAVGPSYTPSENYMGNAIADAGMIVADHLSNKKHAAEISQLKEQNEKLRKQVQDQTLRPKFGGIYARRYLTPTMAQALGRTNGSSKDDSLDYAGLLGVPSHSGIDGLENRPPVHPFNRDEIMIPLRDIGGSPITFPKSVADRLDLKPFDTMIVEDNEGLAGDEGGQIVSLPRLGDALYYHKHGKASKPLRETLFPQSNPSDLENFGRNYSDPYLRGYPR